MFPCCFETVVGEINFGVTLWRAGSKFAIFSPVFTSMLPYAICMALVDSIQLMQIKDERGKYTQHIFSNYFTNLNYCRKQFENDVQF